MSQFRIRLPQPLLRCVRLLLGIRQMSAKYSSFDMHLLGCPRTCIIFSFEDWPSTFFCLVRKTLRFGDIRDQDSFSLFSSLETSSPDKSAGGSCYLLISLILLTPHTLFRTSITCSFSFCKILFIVDCFCKWINPSSCSCWQLCGT